MLREQHRKLPASVLEQESERFALYEKVFTQQAKNKNKIYSLHEPDVYCLGKGKDHKPYEHGHKALVISTLKRQVIVEVESHDEYVHDAKMLKPALTATQRKPVNSLLN